jgi:hypothetical protein
MLLTPEKLYLELGRLIAEMPELASGPITSEVQRWLVTASAVVKSSGSLTEALQLTVACENLDGPLRARNAETITNILHHLFIKAEANAPREVRGSVQLIGGNLDAFKAISRLLATASSDAFLVEPDAAGKILADYGILAPERTTMRLLADEAQYRPSLIGGVQRWHQRFGDSRKLMVRVASANTLHERLILLDSAAGCWERHLVNWQKEDTRLWSECVQKRKHVSLRCMRKFGGGEAFVTTQLSVERVDLKRFTRVR